MRMEVLAINGSPKGEKSNTMLILQPFLEGLEGDGASTELVQVRDLEVRTCDGDYFCWAKKPGVCRYHDDMEDPREQIFHVVMIAAYPRLLGPAEIVAVTGSHLQVSYLHQLCGGPVSFQSFQEGLKDQHGVTLLPFRASVYGQDLHAHPFLSDAASISRTVSLGDTRL